MSLVRVDLLPFFFPPPRFFLLSPIVIDSQIYGMLLSYSSPPRGRLRQYGPRLACGQCLGTACDCITFHCPGCFSFLFFLLSFLWVLTPSSIPIILSQSIAICSMRRKVSVWAVWAVISLRSLCIAKTLYKGRKASTS